MKAVSRKEHFLNAMAGNEESPTPVLRKEFFYAKAAGSDVTTPDPLTREEFFLDGIAKKGGATLIEKTITANGEYLPADDDADGYSKVVVDVPSESNPHFNRVVCGCTYDSTHLSPFYIFTSQNGQYTVSATESLYPRIYLASPLTTVELDGAFDIYFTPSAEFNPNTAFKANGSYLPLTQSSITPQPNDGKVYKANWSRSDNGMEVVALSYVNSGSTNFVFTIE